MNNTAWMEERIQSLIDSKVEESLTLEYKAAAALAPKNGVEITKGHDVVHPILFCLDRHSNNFQPIFGSSNRM